MNKYTIDEIKNTAIYGNSLLLLPKIESGIFDAVIADSPYSSGGINKGDRAKLPSEKYQNSKVNYAEFDGENMDARSWLQFTITWMTECHRLLKENGYMFSFTDWRQLPAMTDAIQLSGFIWRGIIVWNKGRGSRAPHKGYFRHQCEYVVWGTKGACKKKDDRGPCDGFYEIEIPERIDENIKLSEKIHMTGKPLNVYRKLLDIISPGGNVLDPFAGSGPLGVVAPENGCNFTLIESNKECFKLIDRRLVDNGIVYKKIV